MIKIVICDTDIKFLEKIKNKLDAYFEDENYIAEIFVYTNNSELLSMCESEQFDIAFIEPEMHPMDGIKTGRILKEKTPDITLVYISDVIDYSIHGYRVNAFRYILKKDLDIIFDEELNAVLKEYKRKNKVFVFKKDGEPIKVPYKDIVFLMSDVRKVILHTKSGERYSFYAKINDLEDQFTFNGFLRVQRSYMVNLSYAVKLSNYNIYLNDGTIIPTSKKDFQKLKSFYTEMKKRI